MSIHRGVKAVRVNTSPLIAQDVLGEIQRKAVCIIEPEGNLARQRLLLAQLVGLIFQQLQAAVQRLLETPFLQLEGLSDQGFSARQLLERAAHHGHKFRHQLVHHRITASEHVRMSHTPAHDAAQDITATFIDGSTPSAIRNELARRWSAITR